VARLKEIAAADMTAEQKAAAERISQMIHGLHGPYAAWIQRPHLAEAMLGVLHAIRDQAVLPRRMRMMATITVIRHWGADYAWGVNKPLALDAGVPESVVEAVEKRQKPIFDDANDALAYQVAVELLNERMLSDATFDWAQSVLGDEMLTELVGAVGYFSAVALTVVASDIKARTYS
jgi:4-carboxymuconolactone decarboxylase